MTPPRWVPQAAALGFVAVTGLVPNPVSATAWSSVPAAVVFLAALAAVALRIRFPHAAVIATVGLAAVAMAVGGPIVAHAGAALICVFTIARLTDRRTTLIVAALAAITLSVAILLLLDSPWQDVRVVLQTTTFVAAAAAIGDATRSRRAFIDAITERARRAEETKEAEARRRVAEERLRIARDLHDVLAHQIAVINLHSGVASQALRDRPDDAEKSLAAVRQAARTVLGEIGSLLTVLRADDSGTGRAADPTGRPADSTGHADSTGQAEDAGGARATAPVPGLSELPTLVESFERNGLHVERRTHGAERELPGEVDIVAYRVVQEALTNAHKHGADHSALLDITHRDDAVEITVTNTVTAAASSIGGYGLIGARERVASVGGTLHADRGPGPVYRFEVVLPLASRDIHPPVSPPHSLEGST
jgi:signal transduction histidine kinase